MFEQTSPCNAHLSSHALPHPPPPPPTPVTSVRNHMIYHTNIPFSTVLIALISLLTFPTIPPAYIFHGWPGMASVHLRMIVMKNTQKKKKRHNISHTVPGALCATIMFTLCSMSSEVGLYSSVCLCASSCPRGDIAFREKAMRDIPLPLWGHRHGGHWHAGGLYGEWKAGEEHLKVLKHDPVLLWWQRCHSVCWEACEGIWLLLLSHMHI